MQYMKSFTVTQNDAGKRLDRFIEKNVPNLPSSLMYKYIRTKRIKINGKRAQNASRLNSNDVVDLYINDEFLVRPEPRYDFLGAPSRLNIVFEDENIMLLDKKPGLLCHPDDREYVDTLIGRIKKYLYEKGEYDPSAENIFTPSLCNRIDRNTGGIVIAAKNAAALSCMNSIIKTRQLHKYYLCAAVGKMPADHDILEGHLLKNEDKNKVYIYDSPREGTKPIKTAYKVIACKNGLSLCEVELLTGRTHQIRAQFAYIGHPLLGDGKYGKEAVNKQYGYSKQCLYSYKLVFDINEDDCLLSYLDGRAFEVHDIQFLSEFEN